MLEPVQPHTAGLPNLQHQPGSSRPHLSPLGPKTRAVEAMVGRRRTRQLMEAKPRVRGLTPLNRLYPLQLLQLKGPLKTERL